MTYAQQNAKLVLVGKNSTLYLDSSLSKCIDTMFNNTPMETIKLYKVITADLTFYVSICYSIEDQIKTIQISNVDTETIALIAISNKNIYLDNKPIDTMYFPFVLLILEKM